MEAERIIQSLISFDLRLSICQGLTLQIGHREIIYLLFSLQLAFFEGGRKI